jgi:hypothetical protein
MAGKLRRLADDDEFCEAAGHLGLGFAQRELTPQAHLRGLEAAYARVADDG